MSCIFSRGENIFNTKPCFGRGLSQIPLYR
jgi:hypothetical protein